MIGLIHAEMKPKIAGNVSTVKGTDTRKPKSRIATITVGVQQIQNPATAAKSTRHVLISWAVIVPQFLAVNEERVEGPCGDD